MPGQRPAGGQDPPHVHRDLDPPIVQIPVELERQFVVLEHHLPGREQLQKIAEGVATEPGELPTGDELTRLLDASAGLTRGEAENAYTLSLVRHGKLVPETVWELEDPGASRKRVCSRSTAAARRSPTWAGWRPSRDSASGPWRGQQRQLAQPRGILLLGVPGSGKSPFCKALGNETGRPTLILDVGRTDGFAGGPDRSAIFARPCAIIDAMAPCSAMIDEVEKALSGVRQFRPDRLGRLRPALRHVADLAQRPHHRRVRRLHLQRHQQAAAGILTGGAV